MRWWALRQLTSGNEFARVRGIRALSGSTDPDTVLQLLSLTKDNAGGVREAALQALANVRDSRVLESAMDGLNDGDPCVRQAALGAWLNQTRDIQRHVVPLLQHSDDAIRKSASEAIATTLVRSLELVQDDLERKWRTAPEGLGGFKRVLQETLQEINGLNQIVHMGAPAAELLLDWMTQEQDYSFFMKISNLRSLSGFVLGYMGDVRAIPFLIAAMDREVARRAYHDANVSALGVGAVCVLTRMGKPGIQALLPQLKRDDVRHLLEEMGWTPETEQQRLWVARVNRDWDTIVRVGGPYMDEAIDGIVDLRLAVKLAQSGDPKGIKMLGTLVLDDKLFFSDERLGAAVALGTFADIPGVAEPLLQLISERPDYRFLDRLPTEGAMWLLRLRQQVVKSLGNLGEPRAVKVIRPLVDISSEFFRILGEFDSAYCKTSVEALEQILGCGWDRVEIEELFALKSIVDIDNSEHRQAPALPLEITF